jgi:hypothetical protein
MAMELSRRELLAAYAMNALVSDPDWNVGSKHQQKESIPEIVEIAYKVADEMIRQSNARASAR